MSQTLDDRREREPGPALAPPCANSPDAPELLIREARRRRRRRWVFSALVLAFVGVLLTSLVAHAGSPRRLATPHHVVSAASLQADARGLPTCSSLGVSITPAWGAPMRGAPGITATAKPGFSLMSLRLIEQYLPANCASAQYWGPNHGRRTLVVQFPTQLTHRDRAVLAAGDLKYLHRTGAVVDMHYTESSVVCSAPRSPLCWAGLPSGG